MVEAAEADVVGPAVAADDPDALADQVVGERQQVLRRRTARAPSTGGEPLAGAGRRGRAGTDLDLRLLAAVEQLPDQVAAPTAGASARQQAAGVIGLGVERQAHAQAELGVVLEQ